MYRVKADYQEVDGTISESDFSSAKAALDYAIDTAIDTGIDNTISFIDTHGAIQTNHELASVSYMLFIDIELTAWPDGMSDLIDAVKAATGKNSDIVAKQYCAITNRTRIWKKGYSEIEDQNFNRFGRLIKEANNTDQGISSNPVVILSGIDLSRGIEQ